MPITTIDKDVDALTLTVVADFPAPVRRLWDAYQDPRQLEKFWGPPSYPATFTRHDAYPGGLTTYYMTGPEGDTHGGYWEWLAIDAPNSFEVLDGFLTDDGEPNLDLPRIRMTFVFEATDTGSRMTTTSHFASRENLEELVAMGMMEGMKEAMGQIDAVIADLEAFAAGRGTDAQILSDTQVRVSRVIRGDAEHVWAAHNDPELLKRWMLGPDGWSMPVCEVARTVGETYRYEWEDDGGNQRFGFTGELLESEAPYRAVTTERMVAAEGVGDGDFGDATTRNEMTLTPVESGTLVSILITYPDAETRDMILATGMTDGMEASYARLEETALA
ncbi:SRPBCC family protein [Zhihengliuella halotolerans]|uniref:SRPBCC family protein n=1 Tax=Zhihengliuella halotolerans TaxID=370736 RepID=UPI000C80E748|nr:SRPBCC family protein [Zhihengliuella halotolerans]